MQAIEIYKRILLKVNLNDTSGNVRVPKSTAVIVFNQQAKKWLSDKIDKLNGTDKINELQEFLIPDVLLQKAKVLEDSVDFYLPTDFFDYSRSYSIASKGSCKNRKLTNWRYKNKNLDLFLPDENNKPSFAYEETIVKLVNGKLKVYKDGFSIDKQYLDYYKQPKAIDIEGYVNYDGSPSSNIDPDFSDQFVDEIVERVAVEILSNQQNAEGLQNIRLKSSVPQE